jgi:tRNA(Ile)-lysidine synthase
MPSIEFARAHDMLPHGGLVLCAVSGGADSMCLLVWLSELAPKYGFSIAAAHFNHGLRGESAARDEAFVRDFCAEHNIPFFAGRGDTAAAARAQGWSIEEAGRNLRYAFLLQTAKDIGAVRVATAHNRSDNAETVLMNLIRGAGLHGVSGIAPVRDIFIRPLLETGREEIEDYLKSRRISWVRDESNDEDAYTRNRIRHEIFPLLRELNPRAEENISKTAALLREDEAYLRRTAERLCRTVEEGGGVCVQREALTELPEALQGRVVRQMLDKLGASKKDVTARHIRAILALAKNSGPTAQLSLPRGIVAQNEYGALRLSIQTRGGLSPTPLPPVGEVTVGAWRIRCRVVDGAAGALEERPDRLILNNAAIDAPPRVDRWRENARMTLPGREGSRSLKRLFLDAGFSVERREDTPVLFAGERLAGVPGIGVDKIFEKKEGQKHYIIDFFRR